MVMQRLTEAQWAAALNRSYAQAAAKLVKQGWTRHNVEGRIYPAYFTKEGEEPVILTRKLGSKVWRPTPKPEPLLQ